MSSGIGNRIRSLSRCDRLLLLLTGALSIFGFADNYFRLRSVGYRMWEFRLFPAMILWTVVAGAIAWSVVRQQRRLADYGFTFRRGGLGSLAALAVLHVWLVPAGKLVPSAPEGFLWILIAVGAFMEEIVFRVIAIDVLVRLMDATRGRAFLAILASSALFTIVHIPSKSPVELQGLFISSLILGFVYYKTRSVLLPAWMHAATNAGFAGGILAAALYCGAAAAGAMRRGRNEPARLSMAAS